MTRRNVKPIPRRTFLAGLAGVAACSATGLALQQSVSATPPAPPNPDPYAGRKKVLAIGDVHTGYQHDSVSHAVATIERLGRDSRPFVTYIRTDTQPLPKGATHGTGKHAAPPPGTHRANTKHLNSFDAL